MAMLDGAVSTAGLLRREPVGLETRTLYVPRSARATAAMVKVAPVEPTRGAPLRNH